MAKTKKEIIPRKIQKIFIFSSILFIISNIIPYIAYAVDAASHGTLLEGTVWIYQWLVLSCVPAVIIIVAYLLTSNEQGRLWRLTIASLYSIASSSLTALISMPMYALMFSSTVDTPYFAYLTVLPTLLSALITVLVLFAVRFTRPKKPAPARHALTLLVSIFVMYFITQIYYLSNDKQTMEIFTVTLLSIVGAAALTVLTYLLIPSVYPRLVRMARALLYALVPVVMFGIVTMFTALLPFIISEQTSTAISDLLGAPLLVVSAIIYVVILLWGYRKKYL